MINALVSRPLFLVLLITAQVLCAAVFLMDVVRDGFDAGLRDFLMGHFAIEAVAVVALIAGILFEILVLRTLLQSKAHLERQVTLAAQAFHAVIEAHFDSWTLTPSERDIAHFTVKGCSIAEIAVLRGSAEGTVKSHLNAIYRKAGVGNRGELLSLLIEDLMESPR